MLASRGVMAWIFWWLLMIFGRNEMPKPLPERSRLLRLFSYDPKTGILVRKVGGKKCAPALTSKGYLRLSIDGEQFMAHRVIWKMMTGEEPLEVDHENGKRADNRWKNLRSVGRVGNCRNTAIQKNNTSGQIGVSPFRGRWRATICENGRQRHIGVFEKLGDACRARKAEERRIGYHPNHGRDAPDAPFWQDSVTRCREVAGSKRYLP